MRVTSDFWISAVTRRVFAGGGFAAVLRRGATEAGAIFIIARDRFGEVTLYGPAPQASYDSGKPQERHFQLVMQDDMAKIDARLVREEKFDPDFWLVELETGDRPVSDFIQLAQS